MKRNIFLALSAIALAAGVGAGISHTFSSIGSKAEEVEAAATDWYIVGSGRCAGKDLTWDTPSPSGAGCVRMGSADGNKAFLRVDLKKDNIFKLRNGDDWKGWNDSIDSGHFEKSGTDDIKVLKSGVYDVYLNGSGSIWIATVSDTVGTPSLTPTSKRYWFIQNQQSFWQGGESFGVHVWNGEYDSTGTNAYYVTTGYFNGPNNTGNCFRYVDVPADCTKISLTRIKYASAGDALEIWHETCAYDISDFSRNQLHCVNGWEDTGSSFSPAISHQAADGMYDGNKLNPSAWLLSAVLIDYPTCSTSAAEVANVESNWYSHYDSTINGTVDTATLQDYSYDTYLGNGKKYSEDQAIVDPKITVATKWSGLKAIPSGALSVKAVHKAVDGTALTVGIAAIGLAAGGTMVFLAKRRKEI